MTTNRETRAQRAAAALWQRWQTQSPDGPLAPDIRPATLAEAWDVQAELTKLAGPRIGWKVAASSAAGQRHIGVAGPIAGPLLAAGVRGSGESVPLTSMASVEPEIAFRLGADLPSLGRPYDRPTVLQAVSEALPAIEVPDCRFADVTAAGEAQLVADLACSAYFVLGDPIQGWSFGELKNMRVVLRINGEVMSEGVGANALGDPCEALTWLANAVTSQGTDLCAGDVVMTGAAASPRPIRLGDTVSCEMQNAVPVMTRIS